MSGASGGSDAANYACQADPVGQVLHSWGALEAQVPAVGVWAAARTSGHPPQVGALNLRGSISHRPVESILFAWKVSAMVLTASPHVPVASPEALSSCQEAGEAGGRAK
ncbi:hypothetical protein AAFF_G00133510 [Aldrovandia affinis]|uniref:Uncharacterized protein n=1 Tax=Aldrovandia affinis TaxID=143900 RepID=A0AAD7RQU0_9TELE|nr:hypothetical protein AAFF_G00133510 [Aldrovandia affinis]